MLGLGAEPPLWIETDAYGRIQDIAPDTATLLGLAARGTCARDLRLFFPAAFRSLNELMREAHYQIVEGTHNLSARPQACASPPDSAVLVRPILHGTMVDLRASLRAVANVAGFASRSLG